MGTAQLLAVVLGWLMPPLVQQVKGDPGRWPAWVKLAIAFGTSVVLGTVGALATGQLDTSTGWLNVVLVVFAASQVAYRAWWNRDAPPEEDHGEPFPD